MSESALQQQLFHLLKLGGWTYAHFHDSRRQVRPGIFVGDKAAAGFPDVIAVRGPQLLALELKSEKGQLTLDQKEWIDALDHVEDVWARVVRPSELDGFAGLLTSQNLRGHRANEGVAG